MRLRARTLERHVAGAQVEVRGTRTHAAERRPSSRDSVAPGTVAADAVGAVKLPTQVTRRRHRNEDERNSGAGQEHLHAGLHVTFARAPMPVRMIPAVKTTFPTAAAYAKK